MAGFRGPAGGGLLGQKQRQLASLLAEIEKDETISDVTKLELGEEGARLGALRGTDFAQASAGFEFVKDVDKISATLGKAREGGGKFAGRQLQSKRRTQLADRPGRSQTILTR
jgi:hypothetical protein